MILSRFDPGDPSFSSPIRGEACAKPSGYAARSHPHKETASPSDALRISALDSPAPEIRLPTVQLLHTLPDGTFHFDWMIAAAIGAEANLITFRLPRRIDDLAAGEEVLATPLGLHRRAYLEYEGPVSGDRGFVKRVTRGEVRTVRRDDREWRLEVRWQGTPSERPSLIRIAFTAPDARTDRNAAQFVQIQCLPAESND